LPCPRIFSITNLNHALNLYDFIIQSSESATRSSRRKTDNPAWTTTVNREKELDLKSTWE
jgi:hypothetical protein